MKYPSVPAILCVGGLIVVVPPVAHWENYYSKSKNEMPEATAFVTPVTSGFSGTTVANLPQLGLAPEFSAVRAERPAIDTMMQNGPIYTAGKKL